MSDISLSKAVRANLLSLQNTAEMMNKTQSRLATGNKVNSALDNPSNFFTAAALNSRAADMSNLLDSMASGIKVIEAANNGITALTKNLESMQSTLRQARQDKSFQTQSFEVTENSVISFGGGRFDLGAAIKLADAEAKPGVNASLTSIGTSAYVGPQSTAESVQGAGARTVLSGLTGLPANSEITVAGSEITIGADTSAAGIAATIQAQLDIDATGQYRVMAGAAGSPNDGKIIIETIDTSAAAAEVVFGTTTTEAVKGSVTFNFTDLPTEITVGTETIATGTDFASFVTNLKAGEEDGGYVVTTDANQNITLTAKEFGDLAPVVTGVPAGGPASEASTTFNITFPLTADVTFDVEGETVNLYHAVDAGTPVVAYEAATTSFEGTFAGLSTETNLQVAGVNIDITAAIGADPSIIDEGGIAGAIEAELQTNFAGATVAWDSGTGAFTVTFAAGDAAPSVATGTGVSNAASTAEIAADPGTPGHGIDDEAAAKTKIEGALTAASVTGFTVTVAPGGAVSITADTAGAATAIAVTGAGAGMVTEVDGSAGGAGAITTLTTVGVSTKTEEAAQDAFTVSYDGKQADIAITGLKLGAGPLDRLNWQSDTVASINAQLEGKGIKGVEAKFDDAGKLSLVSKEAEAKTLAVGGKDANRLFGDDTFSIGSAAETGLNATKTTDKFVEFINKKFGGEVRASNDNGKLRIENLSTQELNIGVDKNGNGAVDTVKIDGNTVRANLSKQFNELRDQLDKLSDDASFNGINLLRGDKLKITFNESGSSSIDIQAKDKDGNVRGLNASNLNIDTLVAEDLDTDEKIDTFLAKLSSALTELRTQASSFGSNLSSVENRQSFTKNMINTLETGAANLTLADTNEEAANLLALQTRQQLSSSALSMASQQDQAVLQLLR